MKEVKIALIITCSLCVFALSAQTNLNDSKLVKKEISLGLASTMPSSASFIFNQKNIKKDFNSILSTSRFNAKELPFFCKWEHKLQSVARIPVRIRLGSIDYVNKLECK